MVCGLTRFFFKDGNIDRLINAGILTQRDPHKTYGRTYEYRSYLQLFEK